MGLGISGWANKYLVTICQRSRDPFHTVSFYIKWAKTSWKNSTYLDRDRLRPLRDLGRSYGWSSYDRDRDRVLLCWS